MGQPDGVLDYFTGGAPASTVFSFDLFALQEIMRQYEEEPTNYPFVRERITELAFMGLTGYFEAFCKNHFASILNICPNLVERLMGRHQTSIDATVLLQFDAYEPYKLGFLLAEHYDFGSAHKINVLYRDLLQLTPFSQANKKQYDSILRDRNLLVHHGGIYTPKYLRQTSVKMPADRAVFLHSLRISVNAFTEIAGFLETITLAMTERTQKGLREEAQSGKITLTELGRKAVDMMRHDGMAPIFAT